MKRIWLTLIAAGLLTIAAIAPAAGQESVTIELEEVDESGIGGTVRLASLNGETEVEVLITAGLEEDAVHPVHIHDGTCDDLGGVAYPLEDIVDGVSMSTVDAELLDLMDGEHAVNLHLSADEMDVNVACADIPEAGVGGPGVDDEDDDVVDEEDDAVVDDEDDAVADDEDDAVVDDEDDAAVDDEDDAVADDDEVVDDEVADDEDEAVVDDDTVADDVEDEVVPAAGSVGGPSSDSIALMVALMAGSALGFGVLIRRQASRSPTS